MCIKKIFIVIAYDISSDKTRNKVMKTLKGYGCRANLSVFECLLTDKELHSLKATVSGIINTKTDRVNYCKRRSSPINRNRTPCRGGFRG